MNGDASLTRGVEVISPILTGDNDKTSQSIKSVCKKLNSLEQTVSENCGGHIHIGSDYLTTSKSWMNLIEIWGNCEPIFYIISNKEGESPRSTVAKFAGPISGSFEESLNGKTVQLESIKDLRAFAKNSQKYERYFGINFQNLGNERNTIEFRLSNGTIDADTWIENINLFGGLVKMSEELAKIQEKTEQDRTHEEKRKIECLEKIKDSTISQEEKLEAVLEIIIPEENRDIYRKRYSTNSKLIEQNIEIKEAITEKTAKKSIDVKKVSKKIFSETKSVTGQDYEENDIIIERDLQRENPSVEKM